VLMTGAIVFLAIFSPFMARPRTAAAVAGRFV
jgi:hypothetical protein